MRPSVFEEKRILNGIRMRLKRVVFLLAMLSPCASFAGFYCDDRGDVVMPSGRLAIRGSTYDRDVCSRELKAYTSGDFYCDERGDVVNSSGQLVIRGKTYSRDDCAKILKQYTSP
jgi:hypothetical protein